MSKFNFFLLVAFVALHSIAVTASEVVELSSVVNKKLLGLLGQCGSWNDLADIDCTATPIVNVHYTMDMHKLKMQTLNGDFLNNKKKSLANDEKSIESSAMVYSPQSVMRSLRGPAKASLILPAWTNIPAGQDPSSSGGTTNSAQVNTGDFIITSASGGTVLSFSACGSAESTCGTGSSGDTYFRLVDTITGGLLAYDDDSCKSAASCSLLKYTVPGSASNYPSLTFKIGCYLTSTCSATVTISGISSLTGTTPSAAPVANPSTVPSVAPSTAPTSAPKANPSVSPSQIPVRTPTSTAPVANPSISLSRAPSTAPTSAPTANPSISPSQAPSRAPSTAPTSAPTAYPTISPSQVPLRTPTSTAPAANPFISPSQAPSRAPSTAPTSAPSANPSVSPSQVPLRTPTTAPTSAATPTTTPSLSPTLAPVTAVSPPSFAPVSGTLSYNLVHHGGPINKAPVVKLIFWGSSWATAPGDKIYGMDLFYKGWTGSSYSKISTQYSGTNGPVSGSISYGGYVIDSSTPTTATDTGTILSEVCARIPNPDAAGNGYYVVYTERPRGTTGYCGWHSYGYCGNVLVQFGFIFNLDNDSGCGGTTSASLIPVNAGWTMNAGRMSAGAHALAGVSAHELTEMITDPQLNAWYDSTGAENADKCAWTFPPSNTLFANGITWRIQGDWSNAAALAGTGYQTFSSSYGVNVNGCVGSP